MKKKPKNQVYIPHQDKWNEHFPTPGKPNPNYYTDSGAIFNKHLRTPKQIKTEKEMITIYHILKAIGAIYITYQLIQNEKAIHQI